MHDVRANAVLAAQPDEEGDRLVFRRRRARGEIGGVRRGSARRAGGDAAVAAAASSGPGSSACTSSVAPIRASVGSATPRDRASRHGANSSTPEGTRKHLNPSTPASSERCEVAARCPEPRLPRIQRRRSTAPPPRARFASSAATVGGRRNAVERHVDDGGHAAGGRGAGRASRSLPTPFGPAR